MIRKAKIGKLTPEQIRRLKEIVKEAKPLMSQTNEVECDSPPECPLCKKPTINCSCSPAALAQWQRDEMFRLRKENEDLKLTQADYHGGYILYDDEKWWNEGVVNREKEEARLAWNDLISRLHMALGVPAEGLSADELVVKAAALVEACKAFESNSEEAAEVFEVLYAANLIPSEKPGPRLAEIVKRVLEDRASLNEAYHHAISMSAEADKKMIDKATAKLRADIAERDAIIESQLCQGCDHNEIERLTKGWTAEKAGYDELREAVKKAGLTQQYLNGDLYVFPASEEHEWFKASERAEEIERLRAKIAKLEGK